MEYDYLYVTNLAAFYKINLLNRIAKQKKILVIFINYGKEKRNLDFFSGNIQFEYYSLTNSSTLAKLYELYIVIKNKKFKEFILGGWDSIIMWFLLAFPPKIKKSVIVESSYLESKTTGIKALFKKIFLYRIYKAYVPGKSNRKLLDSLKFKGIIIETKGVGIFNIIPQPPYNPIKIVKNFLYVGRLSSEKNLTFLIKKFNERPHLHLNIVGFGPLERDLKQIANSNIHFLGAINNKDLYKVYQENDVFILPSISETWGLVVEEALNNGLPVIVSNKVGCAEEIVNTQNGLIFDVNDYKSFNKCILEIQNPIYYNSLRKNISEYNFSIIADQQVKCYL